MLEELAIQNLGVMAQATIAFPPGLTVLTGETGAGKTMLLTSLDLLLGGKADPAAVRAGESRALVDGVFRIPVDSPPQRLLEDAGVIVTEEEVILSRQVPAAGRSRAHANGRPVPAAVLTAVGEQLVTVHGQAQQLRLREPGQQLRVLDSFGGSAFQELKAGYREAWQELKSAQEGWAYWQQNQAQREIEIEILERGLKQITELEPQPGEEEELTQEAQRLEHVEELRTEVSAAFEALDASEYGAIAALATAKTALERAQRADAGLAVLSEDLNQSSYVLDDLAQTLSSYLRELAADPQRLTEIHDRRAALRQAMQGRADSCVGLLAWAEDAQSRLDELLSPEQNETAWQAKVQIWGEQVSRLGQQLTRQRHELAEELGQAVTLELRELALPQGKLQIDLQPLAVPGPQGYEDISFLFQAHPDIPSRPVGQGASGGELSRIMLALEVVLATRYPENRAFVFDEIDAGIGGVTATAVGQRLARLANGRQVIVVTHLAQVAAFADTHCLVSKETDCAEISILEAEDREIELARMLSGTATEAARRHARELRLQSGVRESAA